MKLDWTWLFGAGKEKLAKFNTTCKCNHSMKDHSKDYYGVCNNCSCVNYTPKDWSSV